MAGDPLRYFRIEAAELHAALGEGVLALERADRDPDLVGRLLRLTHTLKGAARVVRQGAIADHAHAFEETLGPLRGGEGATRATVQTLLGLLDAIGAAVASLGGAAVAPAVPRAERPPSDAPQARPIAPPRSPRMDEDASELDGLLEALGEARGHVVSARAGLDDLERVCRLADEVLEHLSRMKPREAHGAATLAHELREALGGAQVRLSRGLDVLDREIDGARESAEQMKLVPTRLLFTPLERAARDAAEVQGNRVAFEANGGETRIEARVLAVVQAALVQLVRNAIAHGVEPPPERVNAGKSEVGRVTVSVSKRGGRVVFACSDDGRGVDVAALRRAVERKAAGARSPVAAAGGSLVELLLHGGVSTSLEVTTIAGRGIGLDVVREAAERLGGEVDVQTSPGKGTTVSLTVPLALSSLEVLRLEASGQPVMFPLAAVRATRRIALEEVIPEAGHETVAHEGVRVPYVILSRLLAGATSEPVTTREHVTAVVIEGGGGVAVFAVERLLGVGTVVQRRLPALAPTSKIVLGVSMAPGGEPELVLDPDYAVEVARGLAAPPRVAVAPRRVLVIDDSLTSRTLEETILTAAGYEVVTAVSAEEGLVVLARGDFALVVVDVEMPGMDGFTFVSRVKADDALRHVPCILVTSRDAPEDLRRGADVGAGGYIVKGRFDQRELLARVKELVG